MKKYARGGVIGRSPLGGDEVPALLTPGCYPYLRPDVFHCGPLAGTPIPEPHGVALREAAAEWDRLQLRPARIRVLTPLPRRTRLRLAVRRAVNTTGSWLVDHGHYSAALWLWRDRRRGR